MRQIVHIEFEAIHEEQSIPIPHGEEFLCFCRAYHDGEPVDVLWLSVDNIQPERLRFFRVLFEAEPIPDGYIYVGTCVNRHLFVRSER